MRNKLINFLPLLLIILFGFILRIIFISEIPPGLTNDEINIVINAQSILKTGKNIPGVVAGILGSTSGDLYAGIHSELSSYFVIPFIWVFGFDLLGSKLPFAFASIGIVIVGYFLSKRLFNKQIAIVASILLAINPWLIFYGRSAYESIISSLFYLLAIYLTINLDNWRKLYSIPFFLFGFLSYFSAKTLLIPLVLVSSLGSFLFNKSKNLKPIIFINIFMMLFVIIYGLVLKNTPAGARIKELKSNNISQTVNLKRTESLYSPMGMVFENKLTEDLNSRVKASFGLLSANYLFFNSQPESTPSLSIPNHAFMYLIDLVFVILGILYLYKTYPKELLFLSCIIIATFIPNFLNLQGTTFSIRTVVLFPILVIISGVGIFSIYKYINKRIYKTVYLLLVIAIYLISFANFFWIYFYRLPVERSEGWFFSQKVLSKYAFDTQTKYPDLKINITTIEPKHTFYRYLFYNQIYTKNNNIVNINKNISNKNYRFENLTITDKCPTNLDLLGSSIYIIDTSSNCQIDRTNYSIRSIKDSGDRYIISSDILCENIFKKTYPLIKSSKLLNVELLSIEDFCKNYISENKINN